MDPDNLTLSPAASSSLKACRSRFVFRRAPSRWLPAALVALGLLPIWFLSASATILDVPSAYATIQSAVNAGSSGDTVRVAAGTYPENIVVNLPLVMLGANAGVDGRGARGAESVVDAAGSGVALTISASGVTVDGFRLRGGQGGSSGAGIEIGGSAGSVLVVNNVLADNSTGVLAQGAGAATLRRNLFDGNNRPGARAGTGVSSSHSSSLTVDDNELRSHSLAALDFEYSGPACHASLSLLGNGIHDNATGALFLGVSGLGMARNDISTCSQNAVVLGGGCAHVQFLNNRIFLNTAGLVVMDYGMVAGNNSDVVVSNNSMVGNVQYGLEVLGAYAGPLYARDNWWGSITGPSGGGAGTGDRVLADVGYSVSFAGWRLTGTDTDPAAGFQPEPDNAIFVPQLPASQCLSITRPCLTLPINIHRSDSSPLRGFSVNLRLTGNLVLCSGLASVQEFTYMFQGGNTTFQVTDNGGGSYTVDCTILGADCGATNPNGTLFLASVRSIGPDGSGTVWVSDMVLRNCDNDSVPTSSRAGSVVPIDMVAPAAIADLAAAQVKSGNDADGTTRIRLTWTSPEIGATTQVYRAKFGNYPWYDNSPGAGAVPPTPSYPPPAPWQLTSVTASGGTDETTARDFYYYVAFASDICGNRAPVSNKTGGTLNYHLGDVTNGVAAGTGSNAVDLPDITYLGAHYGAALGPSSAFSVLDVGPTTDATVDGRPATDNLLDFEDLMMFTLNYKAVSKPAVGSPAAPSDQLAVRIEGGLEALSSISAVFHMTGTGIIHGISLRLRWNPAVVEPAGAAAGSWLSAQGGLALSPAGGSVDVAVLGAEAAGLTGEGDLASVVFRRIAAGDPGIELAALSARDDRNRPVQVGSQGPAPALPAVTTLDPVAPNPSRGPSTVRFQLARAGMTDLSVYSVDGRRIRSLESGSRSAGRHQVSWDGSDSHGRRVPPGVYFVRLLTSDGLYKRTVTVLN